MTDRYTGVPYGQDAALRSHLSFPVVGIGASAGGLVALRRLFEQAPATGGMAYVVILHLSPRHESQADQVLQRCTRMPVIQVNTPTPIEPNHVYVISPAKSLTMNDGYLRVSDVDRPPGRHIAIDRFFRTLADAHMDRAIGIVLSGTGSDGTVGLARLKEQGGVAIAQLPEDAEYEDMPRSAIASGRVDFVLPAVEIPGKLVELWRNASRIQLPRPEPQAEHILQTAPATGEAPERAIRDILEILHSRTGHDFRHYKRATVLRRIERRMQVSLQSDLSAYCEHLRRDIDEPRALLDDMLIGVTNFFRDREAFEALERDVVPGLFDDRESGPRVWVPGCATGEEAYSIAILLADHADSLASPRGFQVFASDIDEHAIATGRTGLYPEAILTDVPPARLRQFFSKEQNRYRVNKAIRDRVLFALHNALRDPPFSRVDLISCRNLLIYLDRDIQMRLLELFHFALRPGGLLFLGSSESADAAAQYFEVVDKRNRIFRARAQARGTRPLAMPPSRVVEAGPLQEAPPRTRRKEFSFADVHQRVLEAYAPPSLIVDADSNILHMSPGAGRYLRFAGGEPSSNLMAVIDPALRLDLRTTFYQALHSNGRAETMVRLDAGETGDAPARQLCLSAQPFRDQTAGADFLLVMFDERDAAQAPPPADDRRADDGGALLHLEQELQRTRDRLQATIEQSEASNEELKASNEELQSINEELRSATEELETSKEELQSVNEELITVNHELKSKVEETAKINDDLQNFISSTDIATVFVDAGLRIKRYTPKAELIFNIIPGDVGRCLLDITHRLEYPELADDAGNAFETLQLIEREIRSTDGKWYVARVVPYRTAENRIDGAVLTFVDTTSLRPAGERRGQADASVLAPTDVAVLVADGQRQVISASGGVVDLLGYGERELLGMRVDALYGEEERDSGQPEHDFAQAGAGMAVEGLRWYRNRRGDRTQCRVALSAIRAQDEVVAYVLLLGARRKGGAPSWAGRYEAEASVTLRDEFLAVMSHELKNPLNLISVNTELMARLPGVRESSSAIASIETVRRAIRSQTKIIDDLLDMSRIRTGKLALKPEPVDVGMVVTELVEVARLDSASVGIEFRMQIPDAPIMVRGDASRIEQIVWNLLSNAIKFTPQGGQISLVVGVEENYVRLCVQDTGQGIDAQSLPRIFDLFGQGTGRAVGRRGGLGIGLSLVRQLVDLHGGRIEAHSDGPGRGATFTLWLPRFTYPLFGPGESDGRHDAMRWDGLRLLVVDDDVGTADGLAQLLELQGASVVVCHDAAQALERLGAQAFDVVLSDIGMDGMDGYAFARKARALAGADRLALVALSGYARPSDIQEASASGFDAHLSKPLSMDALAAAMRDVLAKRQPQA
ncbi:chemotaxis protein CheB [Luteimonas sp. RC10]|uniref:chemotaxis protein CheB n=1 Tax=Luteimonas sp. RC10 TaxID=2587035 RepID=UPI001621B6B0|nr:chemotaxis protein CheB [Luteimonas sp. RC10]MBB3343612.1 two-component system CheB/CheR fusion protein [Luteimonas sp. RC10]